MTRRDFHFTDGTSDQFWAIALHHTHYTIHSGRQGTAGQQRTKEFATPEAAAAAYEQAIAEKLNQGYIEIQTSHFLQEALERIEQAIRQQASTLADRLQPGLSREAIDEILADFPYVLPAEVYHLFGWHNGFSTTQEVGLLPTYLFLPLETCLTEYQNTLEVYQSLPGVEDWESLYDPRWFPVFCEEGNYYVVPGADKPQETAPVLDKFSEDPDVRVLFDNLTQMMQAIATCWEMGLYQIVQEDRFCYITETDEAAVRRVWLQYQAERAVNVNVLLTEEASHLTYEQRQAAYQDLVDTQHPEALATLQHALQFAAQEDVEQACLLIYQVGRVRSPAAAATLLPYLNHPESRIQLAVVSALVWIVGSDVLRQTPGLEVWVDRVLHFLEMAPVLGLRDVALLLGMMGDRRACEPLLALLHRPATDLFGRDIQIATIKALVRLQDPVAIEPLYHLAWGDSDPTVCLMAGRALRVLGDARGTEILLRLIEADLPGVSEAARRALNLTSDEFL